MIKVLIQTRSLLSRSLLSVVLFSTAFAADVHARPTQILAGGYPSPQDFETLQLYGVTKIVSLLDPRLPEEEILLRTEQKLAKLYGMELIHKPMLSSIAGESSESYKATVHEVTELISGSSEVVYLHCYYGAGRTTSVMEQLVEQGENVASFLADDRAREASLAREAEIAYYNGELTQAIEILDSLPSLDHRFQMMLGWSLYRTDQYGRALQIFEKLLRRVPEMLEAQTGIGFASLALGEMDHAEEAFAAVLRANNDDPDANMGMGMLKFRQSSFNDAESHLKICVEQSPNNLEAKSLLATVSNKLSNP